MIEKTRAINFETLCLALGKSASSVIPVFDYIGTKCDVDLPLKKNSDVFCSVTKLSEKELESAYSTVKKSFDTLDERVKIIDSSSPLFPKGYKEAAFLYLLGDENLLLQKGISVVGTRNPSNRGVQMTREAVSVLDKELVIVSGMALGIDGVSHIQALADDKHTIAVLGTPINTVYPKEHEKLQQIVAEKGLLVSQFSPSAGMQKYFFMLRNQLMSRVSCATLIVESSDGGGGVREAEYTSKQGKPVFVMKEVYDNRTYLWPRTFEGIKVVKDASAILKELAEPVKKASPQLELF